MYKKNAKWIKTNNMELPKELENNQFIKNLLEEYAKLSQQNQELKDELERKTFRQTKPNANGT
ncbi:hypothetical protein C2G38_2221023 [Gigaspora rosea]|uniref:Uncharacterized protein n=1 Tax=Gigaspora rosea TaxID=44941 RepID=A0A397UC69_9GLOM|nr:hypothetical protein C2G38_2221023 [Gigaspora rosea]